MALSDDRMMFYVIFAFLPSLPGRCRAAVTADLAINTRPASHGPLSFCGSAAGARARRDVGSSQHETSRHELNMQCYSIQNAMLHSYPTVLHRVYFMSARA